MFALKRLLDEVLDQRSLVETALVKDCALPPIEPTGNEALDAIIGGSKSKRRRSALTAIGAVGSVFYPSTHVETLLQEQRFWDGRGGALGQLQIQALAEAKTDGSIGRVAMLIDELVDAHRAILQDARNAEAKSALDWRTRRWLDTLTRSIALRHTPMHSLLLPDQE